MDIRKNDIVNEDIAAPTCIVIASDGRNLGEMATDDAIDMAFDEGLDLVVVRPDDVPVCKVMDYSKMVFDRSKAKANGKKKKIETKQMKFRPNIGEADLQHKCKMIRKFLDKGHKVQVIIMFRGREMSHIDRADDILERIAEEIGGTGAHSGEPIVNGRDVIATFTPAR